MPIYEYQCSNCGHRFEFFQSIKELPMSICPNCQGALKKLISPAGIIFKGSGWYKTDSRPAPSEAKPADKAAEATANGKTNGADKASGDAAKPAAESASKQAATPSSTASTSNSGKAD